MTLRFKTSTDLFESILSSAADATPLESMKLKLIGPGILRKEIISAAEGAFPEECCGFLIGPTPKDFEKPGRTVEVQEIRPLPNGWEAGSRTHRYQIDPKVFARTEAELAGTGRAGLSIVGFYHSHPNVPAWPSPFDLMMAWPCYSYLIVSVREEKAAEMRSWMRSEDGQNFIEEEVVEGD